MGWPIATPMLQWIVAHITAVPQQGDHVPQYVRKWFEPDDDCDDDAIVGAEPENIGIGELLEPANGGLVGTPNTVSAWKAMAADRQAQ